MEIIKNGVGVAFINYDFDGLGMSESFVYFDTGGQITKIDLLDETIEKGIRLQRRLLTSVKYPAPGELGKIYPFQKVEFESKDGLLITGNLYEIDPKKPTILLCHQATFNKFEYTDIAPKLNQLGFNCLAIDQRSGGPMAEHYNETYLRAIDQEKSTEYLEAEKDILASVDFLKKKFKKKIIIWGSSYSSTLSLFVAADHKAVSGVIAFSPSELFRAKRAPLEEVLKKMKKPFLITSSKEESNLLSELLSTLELKENQSQFIPESEGFHGSRALWESQKGADEYWSAVRQFLFAIYPQK